MEGKVEALIKKRYLNNAVKKEGVTMKDENRTGKDRRESRQIKVRDRTRIVEELTASLGHLPRYEVDSIFNAIVRLLFPYDIYREEKR